MGNVSSNRYDVFPAGSYTIGDEWHVVDEQIDLGVTAPDCLNCGGSNSCYDTGPFFTSNCPGCGPGYTQTLHLGLCWTGGTTFVQCCWSTCCINSCNTCHVPSWFTKYKVYKYQFLNWVLVNEYTVPGQFWS
ncbi:hypothetical protein EHO57_13840 [Leptospira langatensis]|uniref:Uncharacterized protein n=1 Tax=Leptospira langatensis TaxID=2484983 RepID=A0A5R2ASQ5_9LEPT|nr:hypothetical protein EHO57_13840 [Leptospira langatensis]